MRSLAVLNALENLVTVLEINGSIEKLHFMHVLAWITQCAIIIAL
jgi:hypothetical protein